MEVEEDPMCRNGAERALTERAGDISIGERRSRGKRNSWKMEVVEV